MIIKDVFGDKRIVGLAGEKNSGKTNNLAYVIKDFRKKNKSTEVYAYGLPEKVFKGLNNSGYQIFEISSLEQLIYKKDCIIIIDEFQKLKLNDRRYKDQLNDFVDFVYHNNVYVIFSSPNIREFNKIIGGVIERWLLKNVRVDMCVNGSQLKDVVEKYKGKYKSLKSIIVPKSEILIINDDYEKIIYCEYVEEADNKKENKDILGIFSEDKNVNKKDTKKTKEKVDVPEEFKEKVVTKAKQYVNDKRSKKCQ